MALELAIIIVLVLVNGLFAGAEIATVTVRKTRIDQLVLDGNRRARALDQLRSDPERFLATVQVGITVVSMAAAAYGGDTLAKRLTPVFQSIGVGQYAHGLAFAIVVMGISYLSLVLGELVPKSLALRRGEGYALLVARPLLGLAFLARPVAWLLTSTSNAVLKVFGDRTSFSEARVSADELKAMLEDAGEAGALHPRVGVIAARAIDLNALSAGDVMVPRNRIVAIDKAASVEELRALVAQEGHSRIPLQEGGLDNVVGVVSVRDVFTKGGDDVVASFGRPITFVPDTMRAVDVLHTLQTRGAEIAMVVDEHGGTAGLLTREDLAEELFGAVAGGDLMHPEPVRREKDGSVIVIGNALVREVNRELDLKLPESEHWSTVAGMCIGLSHRLLLKGERVQVPNGPLIEVLDASARKIRAVRIHASSGHPD